MMNLQTIVQNAIAAEREKELAISSQLTLGELILKVEALPNPEASVYYYKGDQSSFPTDIDSWRGIYKELALNINTEEEPMKVHEFLKMLKSAVGKTFTGYKGGEFLMSRRTPIWVANYGNSGSTAVIDVEDDGDNVYLITEIQ